MRKGKQIGWVKAQNFIRNSENATAAEMPRVFEQPGKNGAVYGPRHGFCLESQFYPDAIHHPNFPSPVLRAGEQYQHATTITFTTA